MGEAHLETRRLHSITFSSLSLAISWGWWCAVGTREVLHLHVEWARDDEGLGDGAGHLGGVVGWVGGHLAYLGKGLLVDVIGRSDERGVAGVHPSILHVLAHSHAHHLRRGSSPGAPTSPSAATASTSISLASRMNLEMTTGWSLLRAHASARYVSRCWWRGEGGLWVVRNEEANSLRS